MGKKKVVFCDYYNTLVELPNPFEQLNYWIDDYLKRLGRADEVRIKYKRQFMRRRAILYTSGAFYTGTQLLVTCCKDTCDLLGIEDFSNQLLLAIYGVFLGGKPYDDSMLFVNQVKEKYKFVLLTNADNDILTKSIDKFQFQFDFVITSEDAKANKPDDAIYQFALKKLGISGNEAIHIGDSLMDDVVGSRNNGIECIWLNRKGETIDEGMLSPMYETESLIGALEQLQVMRNK